MKRYLKELIVFILQLLLFYILPLFAGPTDAMGLVLLIILGTFLLSFVLGIISNSSVKYSFPFYCAIVFLPSIFIYYNESALVHSAWYLVVSGVGLLAGCIINILVRKLKSSKGV